MMQVKYSGWIMCTSGFPLQCKADIVLKTPESGSTLNLQVGTVAV